MGRGLDDLLGGFLGGPPADKQECEVLVGSGNCGEPMVKVEVWKSAGGRKTRVRVCTIHMYRPKRT